METLLEMAKDLGHAIQQDERFVRVQMAQARADEDAALQELIGEFNLKRMALNAESSKSDGEQDNEKLGVLNEELREVYAKVMANESMMTYQAAKAELEGYERFGECAAPWFQTPWTGIQSHLFQAGD